MATASVSACAPAGRAALRPRQAARVPAARAATVDRPIWMPGSKVPEHLDGSLPGDYGFDPLRLGSDETALKWFQQAELVNARWAMLGAAGIVIPGLLTKMGILNVPVWYDAGKVSIEQSGIPFSGLVLSEFIFFHFVEVKRWQDFRKPGSQADGTIFGITDGFKGQSNGYPGGLFDPMGMSSPEMQQKEIKNGRLAMLAMLGFFSQSIATGKGPIDNLFDHMANPGMVNFATNAVSLPKPPTLY